MAYFELSEQELIRRESLEQIRALGIEPYPAAEYKVTANAADILDNYERNKLEYKDIKIAGRIMARRIQGKASFIELQDSTSRIQVYIARDEICSGEDKTMYYTVFKKLLDMGDIIGIEGFVFTTQVGEITIHATKIELLSKSIRPLPIVKTDADGAVYDSFNDPELKYRQRYVDLNVNPEVRNVFMMRSQIMTSMRQFFNNNGYLEVETPILQPIAGGAAARPFITHHNALDVPLYLRVANELYLKRLIVGGMDGVYEFAKDFRNEGMDRTHNPEFTVMEIYVAFKDYNWMMDFTEEMIEKVVMDCHNKTEIPVGEKMINFARPFKRISMADSIKEFTGFDINGKSEEELIVFCKEQGIEVDASFGKGKLIDEIFGEKCEGNYIQPTFITDYPVEMSPLCKRHRDNPELTERFELMINGKEVANAYTELNDPIDQRARFEEQMKLADKGDDEAMIIDYDFLRALEYGMPPTSGMGIGIDRLTMLITNQHSIQDVLFFPQMRPEKFKFASDEPQIELTENEKAIYDILKKEGSMNLLELRDQAGLSNKGWDKGMKGLSKHELTSVVKNDDGTLTVSVNE
jgi:lysyl-tRNA synthetase class 2